MRKWILMCSTDADLVDYDEVIESEDEPGFWDCYEIAAAHGCPYFSIYEYDENF